MAGTFTQVAPDSTGDKIAGQDFARGGDTVIRQEVVLGNPSGDTSLAAVLAAIPALADMGLVVRPIESERSVTGTITTTDVSMAAPSASGVPGSGTPTAGSYVAVQCFPGATTWDVWVTGLTSGSLYFEESPDSTDGVNGIWASSQGRIAGWSGTNPLQRLVNSNSHMTGVVTGSKWFRVRSQGALSGTPSVVITLSRGTNSVSLSSPLPTGIHAIGSVTGPTLTKGTQAASGFSVQDLKDAGRQAVTITYESAAPVVAETLLSVVKTTAGVAAAGATSIGVTSGKTLRITSVILCIRTTTAANPWASLRIRTNPSGATVIGSPSLLRAEVGGTAAVIGNTAQITIPIPEGMEFSGTQTLGLTLANNVNTNIASITLIGYEY